MDTETNKKIEELKKAFYEAYNEYQNLEEHPELIQDIGIPVPSGLHSIPFFRIFSIIFSFSLAGGIYDGTSGVSDAFFDILYLV